MEFHRFTFIFDGVVATPRWVLAVIQMGYCTPLGREWNNDFN